MTELKSQKFIREEEDGSTTTTYAMLCKGVFKTHNNKGPAIINEEQKIKEYYLYGLKMSKDDWVRKSKLS